MGGSRWEQKALELSKEQPQAIDTGSRWEQVSHQYEREMEKRLQLRGAGGSFVGDSFLEKIKQMAINAPASAKEFASDVYMAIRNLDETVARTAETGIGMAQAFVGEPFGGVDYRQHYLALEKHFKDTFGSLEKLEAQMIEKPFQTFADIASVLMPAGKFTGIKQLTKAGAAMEPIRMATAAAKIPFKLIPESVPVHLYQSAVKFTTTAGTFERGRITRTALKHGIMPTIKGMHKLRGYIDDYNAKITKLINTYPGNQKIPVARLLEGLERVKKQFQLNTDDPIIWDQAFKVIKKRWARMEELKPHRNPMEIQRIKQNIYKELESYYEKHKASLARIDLRKRIAKNARLILEDLVPEVKKLNKNEGALIELFDAIEAKANRITNRDLISIGLPVKMGTGAGIGFMVAEELGGKIGTYIGFMLGIFDTPQVKAKIALLSHRLRELDISVKPTASAVRLGLYQAEQVKESIEQQGVTK